MLADCLTKRGVKTENLMEAIKTEILLEDREKNGKVRIR